MLTTITPCAAIKCGYYAKCEVRNGSAGCVCPALCPAVLRPVCGSNGVTYGNLCELKRDVCKKEEFIKVVNEGPCKLNFKAFSFLNELINRRILLREVNGGEGIFTSNNLFGNTVSW